MRRLDKLRVVGGRILNWIGRCWVPIVVTVAAVIWLSGLIIIISSMFSVAKQLQDIRTAEASVEENADEAKSNQKILLESGIGGSTGSRAKSVAAVRGTTHRRPIQTQTKADSNASREGRDKVSTRCSKKSDAWPLATVIQS